MVYAAVKRPELFEITDERTGEVFNGCDQRWYKTFWQRMAGCGPSAVSNIAGYLSRRSGDGGRVTKAHVLAHMEEVWRFVTPTVHGIPEAVMLEERMRRYAEHKAYRWRIACFDIPRLTSARPDITRMLAFIGEALGRDTPVAFLSLDRGREKRLDSWHWVTLIAAAYMPDGAAATAAVLDGGERLEVDLKKWYDTTARGGGLVAVTVEDRA